MKQKLEVLLKKVFYSSIASLSALHGEAKVAAVAAPLAAPEDETAVPAAKKEEKSNLSRKFILKLHANDQAELLSHRSHRSHSSHRSHYSSSSGSYSSGSGSSSGSSSGYSSPSTTAPTPSPSVPTPPRSSPFSLTAPSSQAAPQPSVTVSYKLGDRVLKRGMTGPDVTEMANILIRKGYLFLKDGSTSVTGETFFDEVLEDALMKFQRKQAISPDGQVNPLTLYYLNH